MRPERGLVARAALEAPDLLLLTCRVAPPRTREDARPRRVDGREVAPELEDDLVDQPCNGAGRAAARGGMAALIVSLLFLL